jgi:excinuclease ABC subunit C
MGIVTRKLKNIPQKCGVYIFKKKEGNILYVGKANNLRQRIRSYSSRFLSSKTQALVSKTDDLSYILTNSPIEAQLLEASLIKKHQPNYNISLRDDKSFPFIRITEEKFPRVFICRKKKKDRQDKSIYFGPYTNAKLLHQALKIIRKIFGFRTCLKMPKQPCLYFRLKLCPGPCVGKISYPQYRENIEEIRMFLESRYEELMGKLYLKMQQLVSQQDFEAAAKIRDQICAFGTIGQHNLSTNAPRELEDLRKILKLKKIPRRIEAFDISNISGKQASAAMVSFYKGLPDKDNYRKFKIKTTETINDYAMLSEVIQRRYIRVINEKLKLPDLVVIDGGRSHLSVVDKEIKKLGIDIPLLAIAKPSRDIKQSIARRRVENLYIKDKKAALGLAGDSPAMNLLRRIRDEAHRFAISYHHILRRKKAIGK